MADALTLAVVGAAGTVTVALVTVVGTVVNARMQARLAERGFDRADAVRADERLAEERRRDRELEFELRRARENRLADADSARLTRQRDTCLAFVAQAQTVCRMLRTAAQAPEGFEHAVVRQEQWERLNGYHAGVLLELDADQAAAATGVVDTLYDAQALLDGRRGAPDVLDRLLTTANGYLRDFIAGIRDARTS